MEKDGNATPLRLKVALLTASVIIGLCLAECGVRVLRLAPEAMRQVGTIRFVENPKMVYEYVPDSYDGFYRINKQGFNDADFIKEKPDNLVRIAMLGDSITFGVFVTRAENFSDRLEVLLNQRSREIGSLKRYDVMNFGVGGYNLEAEVELLKEKVLAYRPDIVIVNMFFNDNEPVPGIDLLFAGNYLGLTEAEQIALVKKYVEGRNSPARWFERQVLYRSKLYLLLAAGWHNLRAEKAELSHVRSLRLHQLPEMACITRGFREMDNLRKRYGFKVLICLHPSLLFGENSNDDAFASIGRSFGFDSFYMMPYYKKEALSKESLQLKDPPNDRCHPNAFGHLLIAKAMLQELKNRRFIDSRL